MVSPGSDVDLNQLTFGPDNATLILAGGSSHVLVWPLPSRANSRVLTGHSNYVYPVAFSPDGGWFASAGWDGNIRLWETAHRQPIGSLPEKDLIIAAFSISPDGKLLASLEAGGHISLWEKASLQMVAHLPLSGAINRGLVHTLAFGPDSHLLYYGEGNRIRRWEVPAGRELEPLTVPYNGIRLVAFSPDGLRLAVGGYQSDVLIVEPETGQVVTKLEHPSSPIQFLTFSPDGKMFVTAGTSAAALGCQILRKGFQPYAAGCT